MPENTTQLLQTLDLVVRQELVPYFASLGFTHSSGEFGPDDALQACNFSNLESRFFWWTHRFSSRKTMFNLSYGDREFVIETSINYIDIKTRFAPWELLLAAEVPDPYIMNGNAFVLSTDFMNRTIAGIAEGVRKYWPILSPPASKLIDRAKELRDQRLVFAQKEERSKDRERAATLASKAFHENRLNAAIKLLIPYEDDDELSRASRMLLRLARKQTR